MPKPCSLPVSSAYRWTIFRARPSPTPSIHNTELFTMGDVIIIGGSFAGLAGALQLGRARRKVTVLDTGLPRNRFAGHSHAQGDDTQWRSAKDVAAIFSQDLFASQAA